MCFNWSRSFETAVFMEYDDESQVNGSDEEELEEI